LLEQAIRAVYNAVDPATGAPIGFANVKLGTLRANVGSAEKQFGVEYLVELTLREQFFDHEYESTTAAAVIQRGT
jgi:hypothetical protein